MSNPNPPASSLLRAPRWFGWLAALALAGYAIFLARQTAVVAGGSDSSGYLNSARLFASGQLLTDLRAPAEFGPRAQLDPMHFLPQGFFPGYEPGRLTPTYPTGLPLHFAVAGKFLGWRVGPFVVVLGAALAALAFSYAVARELELDRALASAAVVILAACPVFLFTSIQPLSDTLATAWVLGTFWAASRSHRHRGWALASGAALAIAVLVRPTNLLFAPAVVIWLGFDWRRWALFVAGGVPGAIWLAAYNHHLYGRALQSGYGDIYSAFARSYAAPTALHFAKWLALLMPSVVLALPFVALTQASTRRPELLALALAFLPLTGLYVCYEVSHEVWWCLRFILPAIPALVLAALLGIEAIARRSAGGRATVIRRASAVGLAVWAIALSWYWTPRLSVFMMKHYETAYANGSIAARDRLPKDAVVLSFAFSGALYFYTDFPVMRWDQMEAPVFNRYVALAREKGRPVCAVLFDSEEPDAFRHCPGEWTRLTTVGNVGLWQLGAPKP